MTENRPETELATAGTEIGQLVGAWWFNYDEWNEEILRSILAPDVRFTCRTDSGDTDYEEFVRVDAVGVDDVMRWQREHRLASPSPLRHNSSNIHITAMAEGEVEFASYIFVTKIVDGRPFALSSGTVRGAAQRGEAGFLLLTRLDVVLDTTDSQPLGR